MSTSFIYSYDKLSDLMSLADQVKQHSVINGCQPTCALGSKSFNFKNVEVESVPHPKKVESGGEDAWFVSENKMGIGVADGVGGWNDFGVDPSVYSRSLMENCKIEIDGSLSDNIKSGEEYLRKSYKRCKNIEGSSTALLCVFQSGSLLELCNLGDSCALVLRRTRKTNNPESTPQYEELLKTIEQQHYFPVPYQLAGDISKFVERSKSRNLTIIDDSPKSCNKYYVNTQKHDLVILGTDGLWDNMFNEEVIKLVNQLDWSKEKNDGKNLKSLVGQLTRAAKAKSVGTALTPFESKCRVYRNEVRRGGKQDDITVVAGIIGECTFSKD